MARARKAKPEVKVKAKRKVKAKTKPRQQDKNKLGRPTDFNPLYCEQVRKLCLLGADDRKIADFFDVHVNTIHNWKSKYPEFLYSIQEGKVKADIEVADSLYRLSTGYTIQRERVIGKGDDARVVSVTEYIPPDSRSAQFWLKNRKHDSWQDKKEVGLSITSHEDALAELEAETGILTDDMAEQDEYLN